LADGLSPDPLRELKHSPNFLAVPRRWVEIKERREYGKGKSKHGRQGRKLREEKGICAPT